MLLSGCSADSLKTIFNRLVHSFTANDGRFVCGHDYKAYRSQIPQSEPIPARPRVNPRTHLTRLYPSGSTGSGFTLRSWSAAVALHDQSPAPAGNTKALIGPRRALIPLVSAQTDGLLVGGCVGDAPLLRCMLLSVSGGEGTRSSEMMGTKWVVMRVVSAAQGELTTLTDKLWTAILTPSSFRSTGAFWGTLWCETAAIPHNIWTFFQPFPKLTDQQNRLHFFAMTDMWF